MSAVATNICNCDNVNFFKTTFVSSLVLGTVGAAFVAFTVVNSIAAIAMALFAVLLLASTASAIVACISDDSDSISGYFATFVSKAIIIIPLVCAVTLISVITD